MGQVLAFRNAKKPVIVWDDTGLYSKLTGSVDFMWHGGWAEIGDHGEIALYKRQSCIGVWFRHRQGFAYYPVANGEACQIVDSVDAAFQLSCRLIGAIPGQPPPDSH